MTVADIIVAALRLPPLAMAPLPLPTGTTCALTGARIERGYALRPLLQKSTAVILDVIRGGLDGYVSDHAARCWQSAGPGKPLMLGGLFFEDGTGYQPRIALAGRATPRGCWRDVVRAVWPSRRGQRAVIIATTDTKKRLWTQARAGALGEVTPLVLCDGNTQASLSVSWPRLLACLSRVEAVYALGCSKAAIAEGLLGSWPVVEGWGLANVLALDRALDTWRGTPELAVALLIAQRAAVIDPPPSAPAPGATPPVAEPVAPAAFTQEHLL